MKAWKQCEAIDIITVNIPDEYSQKDKQKKILRQ